MILKEFRRWCLSEIVTGGLRSFAGIMGIFVALTAYRVCPILLCNTGFIPRDNRVQTPVYTATNRQGQKSRARGLLLLLYSLIQAGEF